MSKKACSVKDCRSQVLARGLCKRHYERAWRAGQLPPLQPKIPLRESHVLSNIDREAGRADCSVCGPGTPIRVGKGKRGSECKRKRNQDRRLYPRYGNPEREAEGHLHSTYDLTSAQYDAMFREQGGRCRICETEHNRLCVDHCHETGRVRGLLCRSCNWAIGHLRDNPVNALAAAIYLMDS